MATKCYQCRLEILPYQDEILRGGKHLHSGCIPDFEAKSPVGTIPLAERELERLFLSKISN
jgi:hypothetical protein